MDQLGRDWSAYADASLDPRWPRLAQYGRPRPRSADLDPAPVPGLFILGLGKLGGGISTFPAMSIWWLSTTLTPCPCQPSRAHGYHRAGAADPQPDRRRAWFGTVRLADRLAAAARPVVPTCRCRPRPPRTTRCRAAPWRRSAMIKARVVAGDRAAGETLLADLHPYLWRRHLDFSMIEEVAHLKTRIRAEHPDLAGERRHETRSSRPLVSTSSSARRHPGYRILRQRPAAALGWAASAPADARDHGRAAGAGRRRHHRRRTRRTPEAQLPCSGDWKTGCSTGPTPTLVSHRPSEQAWLAERSGFASWEALADALVETRRLSMTASPACSPNSSARWCRPRPLRPSRRSWPINR